MSTVLKPYFPKLVSYNRFVELMQEALIPLILYMTKFRTGKCTGISFIDSTTLNVCHNRRIHSHKDVLKGSRLKEAKAQQVGFIFKLHLVANDKGERFSAFYLTLGNVDDRDPENIEKLTKDLLENSLVTKVFI